MKTNELTKKTDVSKNDCKIKVYAKSNSLLQEKTIKLIYTFLHKNFKKNRNRFYYGIIKFTSLDDDIQIVIQ